MTTLSTSAKAKLNFAASRTDGGIWCNSDRTKTTQILESLPVEVADARSLDSRPTLEREGFELHRLPVAIDWTDPTMVRDTYVPQSLDLVQRLTGADHVASFYNGAVMIRDTGGSTKHAPAAEFVHLDLTRESGMPSIEQAATADICEAYPRVKIFNVWRVLTPPPQDVPLALCDQRTLDPTDWVVGRTVEAAYPDGVPYLTSVYNDEQRWYYFSDLTPDDVVVFKGYDSDPEAPMGCLHGAFRHFDQADGHVPRASAETRVIAFFGDGS